MVSIHHHRRLLLTAIPPTVGRRVDHPLTSQDPNIDTNMVIILAALLCVLGLNWIVRCALRLGAFRLGLAGDGTTRRQNKAALRKIAVKSYRAGEDGTVECSICLAEYGEGEKVRVLPKCKHVFHMKCVDKWLVSHSSCPTCRQLLLEPPPPNYNTTTSL